jgi:hypothetical protein
MLSHTATGEWQSFELRMRRRRAERLALRAEAAASAGFEEDARACLAEARALAPDLPEIAAVEAALEREPEPIIPVVAQSPPARSAFLTGATACILLAAFVGGWMAYRDLPKGATVPTTQLVAASEPVERASESVTPERVPTVIPAPVPETVAAPSRPEPVTASDRSPGARAELRAAAPDVPQAREEDPIARAMRNAESTAPEPRPSISVREALPTLPDASAVPAAPPAAASVRVEPPPAAAPTAGLAATVLPAPVDVKAPVVEIAQEPLVRAVLNRYAAAYSALDANAAERVWPTVNHGALSRAFDGLATQRVNLGDCRIDVTGSKARARCNGSATWSPKVGSGTHTESREWTFDLVRVGADWQILNARAQNR